jgi:SAM-dependent methyltransferase
MTVNPAFEVQPAAVRAFDRIAPEYDRLAAGEIFQLLRARTHQVFVRWLAPGFRVLEIGCGTGIDTGFLAARGMRVVACDPSEAMVSRALRRVSHEGFGSSVRVMPCGLHDLPAYLDALESCEGFDGIVSNFGALNCVEHLAPLGALVRRHLRPGGVVILGLMARLCLTEALYFAATRRVRLAGRRLGDAAVRVPVGGIDVPTFYHRVRDVCDTAGRDLRLQSVEGIGIAIPPPYFEPRWQRLPHLVRRAVVGLDSMLAPCPPFNRLGDHVLLVLVKDAADG